MVRLLVVPGASALQSLLGFFHPNRGRLGSLACIVVAAGSDSKPNAVVEKANIGLSLNDRVLL